MAPRARTEQQQEQAQPEQRAVQPTEHSAIVAFVQARASSKSLTRDINYLKKPFRQMAAADPKVIEQTKTRDEANKAIADAKAPYFARMNTEVVKGTTTPVSTAVAALTAELKAARDAQKTALQQFEVFAATPVAQTA